MSRISPRIKLRTTRSKSISIRRTEVAELKRKAESAQKRKVEPPRRRDAVDL